MEKNIECRNCGDEKALNCPCNHRAGDLCQTCSWIYSIKYEIQNGKVVCQKCKKDDCIDRCEIIYNCGACNKKICTNHSKSILIGKNKYRICRKCWNSDEVNMFK